MLFFFCCVILMSLFSWGRFRAILKDRVGGRLLPDPVSGWPYISLLILRVFLSRCISVKTGLINIKLGDFVKLGVLFLTMYIKSCLSHNLQARP